MTLVSKNALTFVYLQCFGQPDAIQCLAFPANPGRTQFRSEGTRKAFRDKLEHHRRVSDDGNSIVFGFVKRMFVRRKREQVKGAGIAKRATMTAVLCSVRTFVPGLLIRRPYIDQILDRKKIWEIRGARTNIREQRCVGAGITGTGLDRLQWWSARHSA